jgi:O-antigen/teichoic acid export membrane protein
MRSDFLWKSAVVLTVANFLAAFANYVFQAVMGHWLSLAEFGYLNSALGMVAFLAVPLTAASQAVTHYLAQHQAQDDQKKLAQLQAASRWWLMQLTWVFGFISLLLFQPLNHFFNFPRSTVLWVVLATIPLNLAVVLGTACCLGLSRFRLLAGLLIGSATLRLILGLVSVRLFPTAETGLIVTCLASLVLVVGLLIRPVLPVSGRSNLRWDHGFVRYLTACFSICLGNFLFLQSDQIIAQRSLSGEWLGLYSAAGLLGRAVVWGSMPILTVFFTQRSGQSRSTRGPKLLLGGYIGLILVGTVVLVMGEDLLTRLILGRDEEEMTQLIYRFATVMAPIGFLQAAGYFYLATRRFLECYCFGILGILYATILILYGRHVDMLLSLMFGGAMLSLLALGALSLTRWSRTQP